MPYRLKIAKSKKNTIHQPCLSNFMFFIHLQNLDKNTDLLKKIALKL